MGFLEKTRKLTEVERKFGWQVFWDTLPYDRIQIGDHFGFGDRAWMESVDLPGLFTGEIYILHMGGVGYLDATSDDKIYGSEYEKKVKHTFIHELTHVWQCYHGFGFLLTRSFINQGCALLTGGDAYEYESGLEWSDYNVEQQAKIVEDWFKGEMSTEIVLYEYIRDHIRNC
jgi:hypothetical protein